MKLVLSENDSLKLYELLGEEFWQKHKQESHRRLAVNSATIILLISFIVGCYYYRDDWLPYVFILIEAISDWTKQFYG